MCGDDNNRQTQRKSNMTPMLQWNIICCCLQDAMTTISHHAMISSANTPRSGSAKMLKKVCTLPKVSTATSTLKTACTMPRARMVSTPNWLYFLIRVTTCSLPKRATMKPLAKDGDCAGYNNEPLATKGIGYVRSARQLEPLATKSNWASTSDNCEDAKAPAQKLIPLVATPHHCHGAPKRLHWNWSHCNCHRNKCVGRRHLCHHRGK